MLANLYNTGNSLFPSSLLFSMPGRGTQKSVSQNAVNTSLPKQIQQVQSFDVPLPRLATPPFACATIVFDLSATLFPAAIRLSTRRGGES